MFRSPRARATQFAAVLVALLTVRLVAGDLSRLHRDASAYGHPRAVVVARVDLALGHRVGSHDLRVVTRPASTVPAGAIARTGDAVGRIVAVPVLAGAAMSDRALAGTDRDGLDGVVTPGHRAVRVTAADGLRPDPGSIVDVLATLAPSTAAATEVPTAVVARAATVIAVDPPPSASGSGSTGSSDGRVGVVLLVTPEEASHIADATAHGALMLALDPPEEACAAGTSARVPVTCAP